MGTLNTDNYTIGMAELYYNSTIAHDDLNTATKFQTTANNLGNIVTTGIAPEVTYIDHYRSVNGRKVKDKTVVNQKSVNVNFTFDEPNQANLAKFFLGTTNASDIRVLENTLDEGSAQLMVKTDVGQDMVYRVPKCVLKPDGEYSMSDEDWHSVGMVLEVIEYQSGDTANATENTAWLLAPYGEIDTANL